ncbi:NAD(P)H-dependent oxidoreductase subunit E [Candidatus Bathyarchaeota archaeon]|nr:NAD(P)H-dependent oxidoreductase subunit E [Candidatus Bathyarchaeota archaeon]
MSHKKDFSSKIEVSLNLKVIETSKRLEEIINSYAHKPGSLIMSMRKIQDLFGYVPISALKNLSEKSKISPSELMGIVSFYHFFSTTPKGCYTIKVCMGTSCYVRGGERILNFLKKELKLEPGKTSENGKFSLEVVRCLGCCGLSPVVAIDEKTYTRMSVNKMKEVLKQY